jgi:hypothetical protein
MNPNDTQNLHLEHEVKGSHHPLCRGEGNNEGTEGSWTANKKIYGSAPKKGDLIKWTTTRGEERLSLVIEPYCKPDYSIAYSALPVSNEHQSPASANPAHRHRLLTDGEIHVLWARDEHIKIIHSES